MIVLAGHAAKRGFSGALAATAMMCHLAAIASAQIASAQIASGQVVATPAAQPAVTEKPTAAVPVRGQPFVIPSLALEMRWVDPAAAAQLGSPDAEPNRGVDEGPVTQVRLSHGYWIGRTEVTQRQWEAVMATRPSRFRGDELPVEQVSWDDAMTFATRLTATERAAGRLPDGFVYSLPSEAQWEHAARAGAADGFDARADELAWHDQNSGGQTRAVATKRANGLGLFDMLGNVWEWCSDWYGPYPGGAVADYTGPPTGYARASRGGSWWGGPRGARPSNRYRDAAINRNDDLGLRLALIRAAPTATASAAAVAPLALAGTDTMGPLLQRWIDLHRSRHRQPVLELTSGPPPIAAQGLAAGSAAIGFTGRALRPAERAAIVAARGVAPLSIEVGGGAFDDRAKTHTMAVFVHASNPLRRITLEQLRAVLAASATARNWDALGAPAAWAGRPIRAHVAKLGTGATDFVRSVALGGEPWGPQVREHAADLEAIDALAADPLGLCVAGLPFGDARVRALAVALRADTRYFPPSRTHVAERHYPLARPLFLHVMPDSSGRPGDAERAFLRAALSAEGQAAVDAAGYTRLPERLRRVAIRQFN